MVTFTGFERRRRRDRGTPPPLYLPHHYGIRCPGLKNEGRTVRGWAGKVAVRGNHKLAGRQLITSMASADAKTSHLTKETLNRSPKLRWNDKIE